MALRRRANGPDSIGKDGRVRTSSEPKRQTLMLPSAVMRKRLQVPQKWWLIDVMKPT